MQNFKNFYNFFTEDNDKPDDETPTWPDIGDVDKDFERGESNFPHGLAYPNRKVQYDKVVSLDSIYGTPQEKKGEYSIKHTKTLYDYVHQHLPWVEQEYNSSESLADIAKYPSEYSYQELNAAVDRRISTFTHWLQADPKRIFAPGTETWWHDAYKKAHDVHQKYPDAESQIEKFHQATAFFYGEDPENPENENNYPLYVTLYDISRHLGGSEEGGWWYDSYDVINGFMVNSYAEAEKAAKMLYNFIPRADLDGQPFICLEYIKGSQVNKEAPHYE